MESTQPAPNGIRYEGYDGRPEILSDGRPANQRAMTRRLLRSEASYEQTDAPGMNRTCARGLGIGVRKCYLQAERCLRTLCAPVIAPARLVERAADG
jgi:hypothetical protein